MVPLNIGTLQLPFIASGIARLIVFQYSLFLQLTHTATIFRHHCRSDYLHCSNLVKCLWSLVWPTQFFCILFVLKCTPPMLESMCTWRVVGFIYWSYMYSYQSEVLLYIAHYFFSDYTLNLLAATTVHSTIVHSMKTLQWNQDDKLTKVFILIKLCVCVSMYVFTFFCSPIPRNISCVAEYHLYKELPK